MEVTIEKFDPWDPLDAVSGADPGIIIAAQRREIANILRSYTGYYDLFSELLQNALDAIEKRLLNDEQSTNVPGKVWVNIDLVQQTVQVTDNGCAMNLTQLQQFLRPNFSFKSGKVTRGSKGVGATYLGYGFNSLKITSKLDGKTFSGHIENGRTWVDDITGTIARPKIVQATPQEGPFDLVDQGTSITIQLRGTNIRPRNLTWYQATTAQQWLALLQIMTPIGGIYLNGESPPNIAVEVTVLDQEGSVTTAELDRPMYLKPHTIIARSGNLIEFLQDQKKKIASGGSSTKPSPKFSGLNGLYGEWSTAELLGEKGECPIQLRLDVEERELAKSAGLSIYTYLAFSTDLWDSISDKNLGLRKGSRVIHGGLQLATKHMPQGMPLTIPMTNNIGFQNLAHIIIHFDNAEPDLGRKGFQPEYVRLAEKVAVSAVTAFRRRYDLLRKPGSAKIFGDELKIETWIRDQEEHEKKHSLVITGPGLFMPTEELPIRSEPLVEQDVVALFNQMLSSGLVRGIQLIASSQYNQYDGLYRVHMEPPLGKYKLHSNNPLGIDESRLAEEKSYTTKTKILEYKYTLDGLVEELQSGVKDVNDIGLLVAWEIGSKWREMFDLVSLLDDEVVHHRQIHGTTHSFTHSVSGVHAFEAIILHDLVRYLKDPAVEQMRQRQMLSDS